MDLVNGYFIQDPYALSRTAKRQKQEAGRFEPFTCKDKELSLFLQVLHDDRLFLGLEVPVDVPWGCSPENARAQQWLLHSQGRGLPLLSVPFGNWMGSEDDRGSPLHAQRAPEWGCAAQERVRHHPAGIGIEGLHLSHSGLPGLLKQVQVTTALQVLVPYPTHRRCRSGFHR